MRALAFSAILCIFLTSRAWAQADPEMHDMDHGAHPEAPSPSPDIQPEETDTHSMDHGGMTDTRPDEAVGNEPAPDPPLDHAADGVFDPAEMQKAREQLRREHGRSLISKVMLNIGEYRVQGNGEDGYRWEGEARLGGNINRFVLKSEGRGVSNPGSTQRSFRRSTRAISPFFDLQAGIRQDFEPTTDRTYAALGFEGLAPYWF